MKLKIAVIGVACAMALNCLAADKYYLLSNEQDGTFKDFSLYGFVNPARWTSDGTENGTSIDHFDPDADYVVRSKAYRLVVKGGSSKEFEGGRIVIGERGNHGALLIYAIDPYITTFGPNGLKLAHGCILLASSYKNETYYTVGKIEVDTVDSEYTDISFNTLNSTLSHSGDLIVNEGKKLSVGAYNGFGGGALLGTLRLTSVDSCKDVLGEISVVSRSNQVHGVKFDSYDTTFEVADTALPGTLEIGANCRLKLLSANDVLDVGTLSMCDNTWLDLACDAEKQAFGKVNVTTAFSVDGVVNIPAPPYLTTSVKVPILTAPADSNFTAENFRLADSACDPYRSLTVETDAEGRRVLYLNYLTVPVFQVHSIATNGVMEHWSDGTSAAVAGKHYYLDLSKITNTAAGVRLWMPSKEHSQDGLSQNEDGFHEFQGESLTLGDNCYLRWGWQTTTPREFTCKHLRMLDGSALDGDQKAAFKLKGGKLTVESGIVKFGVGNGRNLCIDSCIVGNADIELIGYSGKSSSPFGSYQFNGDNSNFKGRITVRQELIESDGVARVNYAAAYNQLHIQNANGLGGNIESFEPKALVLARYGQLVVKGNTTLAQASNRGIFIEDIGRISVQTSKNSPYTFRMETPLAINGTFYKEGVGTLELAGNMAFGEDGLGEMPEAGLNAFIVTGGVVRVCSAGAVDGASMEFRPGSALELAVDFNNEELLACGIRNVKTDTPFVLAEGVEKLPVSFNISESDAPSTDFSIALMTVSSAAAQSVKAMLPVVVNPFKNYSMTLTETVDEETKNVTFGYRFVYQGMKVIVR